MALILKKVCVKTFYIRVFHQCLKYSGNTADLAETTLLKSVPSTLKILTSVQENSPSLNVTHSLEVLRNIFDHQKDKLPQQYMDEIKCNPAFNIVCEKIRSQARLLELNEIIEATKVLCFLEISADTSVVQTLLQMLKCQINQLNIRQIMFLDVLLQKFNSDNHLVEALQQALPLLYKIHAPLQIDKEDVQLLVKMLEYSSTYNLGATYTDPVATSILFKRELIDKQLATSIFYSLSTLDCVVNNHLLQLLHVCYEIFRNELKDMSFNNVLRISSFMMNRCKDDIEYYDAELLDQIAIYAVENDVGFQNALQISYVLSKIPYTKNGLIKYLCTQAASDPSYLSEANNYVLYRFIKCLSNNNFMPDEPTRQQIFEHITNNKYLNKDHAEAWRDDVLLEFCVYLATLNHYDNRLLETVFSMEFLNRYNLYDVPSKFVRVLTLYNQVRAEHSDKYELPEEWVEKARLSQPLKYSGDLEMHLANVLGGWELAKRNVLLTNGVLVDFILCLRNGEAVKLPPTEKDPVPIEELCIPPGCLTICISLLGRHNFSLNTGSIRGAALLTLKAIEREGHVAIPLNMDEFLNSRQYLKQPFLMTLLHKYFKKMGFETLIDL